MSDEPGSPSPSEKAFANDLPQLEQELADRAEPTRSDAQVRAVVAGLLAGMTHVGEALAMTEAAHTKAEVGLARMVAIWQHGEAAEQDPVLINMLAREVADLNRLVPGAVDKVRNAFEDMKARGLSMAEATEGWP